MNKKPIDPFDYAGDILHALEKGVLLTTQANGKVNTMTIAWGTLGIQWSRPIFIAFVRTSRLTHDLLEANGEFTVNVPVSGSDLSLIAKCGTISGRDVDKIAANNLTLVDGELVSVPALKEYPITLECKVVYKQHQNLDALKPEYNERFYPVGKGPGFEAHTAYYGEIVAAYVIEE